MAPTYFLDTNVIIRYLTNDNPDMADRARVLLEQVEQGRLVLVGSESIFVEIVRVLSSRVLYSLPRERVASDLAILLYVSGLKFPTKRTLARALELWVRTPVDFVDALSVAHAERQGLNTIASFDRDFDRFEQIRRLEP